MPKLHRVSGQEAIRALGQLGFEQVRQRYPRAYEKWMDEEDDYLRCKHSEGFSTEELAEILHRKPSAIHSRLRRFWLDVND